MQINQQLEQKEIKHYKVMSQNNTTNITSNRDITDNNTAITATCATQSQQNPQKKPKTIIALLYFCSHTMKSYTAE